MPVVLKSGLIRLLPGSRGELPLRKLPFKGDYDKSKVPVRQVTFQDKPVDQAELQAKIAALKDNYDFLVVGAGLFGSTFARQAKKLKKKCLVIERKPEVGGMLACEKVGDITVHKYGMHLFKMRNEEYLPFMQEHANWISYGVQYVPEGGYNALIEKLLKGIPTITGISYQDLMKARPDLKGTVIYTGPIDEYFDYKHGRLKYNGMKNILVEREQELYQYTGVRYQKLGENEWCRMVEYKYFLNEKSDKTVVGREIVKERWEPGLIPYRLLDSRKNEQIAEIYRKVGAKEPNVVFAGRLGTCMYLDMCDTIATAVSLANDLVSKSKKN